MTPLFSRLAARSTSSYGRATGRPRPAPSLRHALAQLPDCLGVVAELGGTVDDDAVQGRRQRVHDLAVTQEADVGERPPGRRRTCALGARLTGAGDVLLAEQWFKLAGVAGQRPHREVDVLDSIRSKSAVSGDPLSRHSRLALGLSASPAEPLASLSASPSDVMPPWTSVWRPG